jgi:hypothetical protein
MKRTFLAAGLLVSCPIYDDDLRKLDVAQK